MSDLINFGFLCPVCVMSGFYQKVSRHSKRIKPHSREPPPKHQNQALIRRRWWSNHPGDFHLKQLITMPWYPVMMSLHILCFRTVLTGPYDNGCLFSLNLKMLLTFDYWVYFPTPRLRKVSVSFHLAKSCVFSRIMNGC